MSDRISRGEIISLLAGIPLAVAATAGTASAAGTKAQFKYQPKPKGAAKCMNCKFFTSPSSCTVVAGVISPNGWCIAYTKK